MTKLSFPQRGATATRFADVKASSYDKKKRTAQAVISMGTAVQRWYGTEKLKIASDSVILDRLGRKSRK